MNEKSLRAAAESVLRANDRGGSTIPSAKLYPHQWNWDSAFAAIGWSHIDPRRAARELHMLLRGQWDDGLIPHIIFNPAAAHYEPGPKAWKTEGAVGAPKDALVSSITQPPVAATAARIVFERAGGDAEVVAELRDVASGLERWHRWFAETRDPGRHGVPCIVHPWESGLDNAPRWDAAMKRIEPGTVEYARKDDGIIAASQRPTRYDYDRYFFLVNERARHGFAPPRVETEPFLVHDVALAAILCRAERDLAVLAAELGVASSAKARAAALESAIQRHLFDEASGTYHDYDVLGRAPIRTDHVAMMLPLFAGIVPAASVERFCERLRDESAYATPFPIPTVPIGDPLFEAERYWRGPSWINVNWMMIEGLRLARKDALADDLTERTLQVVDRSGFYEYFDPRTGKGLGSADFSWSAALTLDLLARR